MKVRARRYLHRAVFNPDESWCADFGCDGRGRGFMQAYHRHDIADCSPYAVANEWICAGLGRFLGLPIPPCALTYDPDRKLRLFSSLDFNFDRDELPPILPEPCVEHLPRLSTGIILFDILIANEDRHDANLAVDQQLAPKAIRVFDHDQALFGGGNRLRGIERLTTLGSDHLGILGDDLTAGNLHCLLRFLNTDGHFKEWLGRIGRIPDWFIEDLCSESLLTLRPAERQAARQFLIDRRRNLDRMLRVHRGEFTRITDWSNLGEIF